jgi:hypothetical protein
MGVNGAYIAFNNNSNVFKIFARELRWENLYFLKDLHKSGLVVEQ